jgi:lysophospholipase L1-like esterase
MNRNVFVVLLCLVICPRTVAADAASLQSGDFVAVVGDSITEQKLYSVFIEDYLLMCQPEAKLRAAQFGWSGEKAGGFARRMADDMLPFRPTVVTTCYGMNDGGYSPMDPEKGREYRRAQSDIVRQCKQANVRLIVVGSPGCVDADTFRKGPKAAAMYNQTLAAEREIAREVARAEEVVFADVFGPMMDVMTKAKAKYGRQYHLAGADGIHPAENGHLVMAYAMLKALGCNGEIGKITVDLGRDRAEASSGHRVVVCQGGAVEIESARYPFCFFGDPAKPKSTRGVIEFLPFNQELNRFLLIVSGGKAARYKVTWGDTAKEFTAAELAGGINLAAEFLDNPFCRPFQQVEAAIRKQQAVETPLVKGLLHSLPEYRQILPEQSDLLERVKTAAVQRNKVLFDAAAAAVTPVRHKITIEAVP